MHLTLDPPWAETAKVSEHNPLGKIPALVREAGTTLYDSRVIVEYLDSLVGDKLLIPADIEHRLQAKTIESLADGISDAVILQVIESWRPQASRSTYFHDRQEVKIDRALQSLNLQILNHNWFIGESISIADISVGCALGMIGLWRSDLNWFDKYPSLHRFWEVLSARPSFSESTPKIAPGATFPRL
jgi:glutathione S-transferase